MMKKRQRAAKPPDWPPVISLEDFNRQYLPDEIGASDDRAQFAPSQFGKILADDSMRLMRESLETLVQ
jgi:hypothetical protein